MSTFTGPAITRLLHAGLNLKTRRPSMLWLLTGVFIALVLALNSQLFTQPIIESGDYAANSLLVQQAKHFNLVTGHYSRWHFHHPGPAFLYLFALGEFLFYDLLHIVPAPYNAQLLITIIFNGILLGATLYIFQRHSAISVPLALLAVGIVTELVNSNGPPSMIVSNWMPDVLLFPFLLFVTSAASVLAGRIRELPLLAASGMLLIHAHFAQLLFVGGIGSIVLTYLLIPPLRQARLRRYLFEYRRDFVFAIVIVVLFSVPPLIEFAIDKPNNFTALLSYSRQFGDVRNNLGMSIGYFTCFLLFIGTPETALTKGPLGILSLGLSPATVVAYWACLGMLAILSINPRLKTAPSRPRFIRYVARLTIVAAILFLYWATRITGQFFAFNGTFVYALHLLAWFLFIAILVPTLSRGLLHVVNVAGVAALLLICTLNPAPLRSAVQSLPDSVRAAQSVPTSPFGTLSLDFAQPDWIPALGLANALTRLHKPFCVNPDYGFIVSSKNVCPDLAEPAVLRLTSLRTPCQPPCRTIFSSPAYSLTLSGPANVTLPIDIGLNDWHDMQRAGFNADEPSYCWTKKHAAIWFHLSSDTPRQACLRLIVNGTALPGRPTRVSMNGCLLGILSNTISGTATIDVPWSAIRPGASNRIDLYTDNAGPAGTDRREIGFDLIRLTLRAPAPAESCIVSPHCANEPAKTIPVSASETSSTAIPAFPRTHPAPPPAGRTSAPGR